VGILNDSEGPETALKQAEMSTPVAEVIRRMGVGELRRIKQLEDENRKLKQLVGRRLQALTMVDTFTRKALAIDVDQGIKGEQVVAAVTGGVPIS